MSSEEITKLHLQLRQAKLRIGELEEVIAQQSGTVHSSSQDLVECGQEKVRLEQSRNKYRKLFNYANDAMFVITLDTYSPNYGYFSDVNNVACKRLGYIREELLNMTPFDIIDENDFIYNRDMLIRLNTEGNATYETSYIRKDGTRFPVEISALRLTIAGEDLFMAIARDITERKQVEEALKKSEHLYRLMADNVHDIIWTTDSNFKPLFISPSFSNLTGYPKAKASDLLYEKIICSSPFINSETDVFLLSDDKSTHWETELTTADNKTICVESVATRLAENSSHLPGIIGVCRNITPRKHIMTELEAAKEEAFAASKAKSEFLANMSHEVRTPMNGVIGMLQLLQMTNLDDEQEEYVQTASISGESLLTIINDILDYAKIEAGKLQITTEPFEIRSVMDPLITSFKNSLNPEKVTLSYSISPEVPHFIVTDRTRLRQILFNLTGNAVKFTDAGEITITIKTIEERSSDELRIGWIISDTGIGIPEDAGEELFEPFTRLEDVHLKKRKGTGLGLSIVKQLVTQMGGNVSLKRNERQGVTSTFDILTKKHKGQSIVSNTPNKAPVLTSPQRRLSALVVEDEPINQQILKAILTKLGHEITVASNGYSALSLLMRRSFDVILMDVQMPELDGLETTQIIRTSKKFEKAKNTPIIALTAYAMTGDKNKCLAAGMDHYLSKPVDVKELAKTLKNI